MDSKKILDIIDDQGNYVLPLHEFLRAVTFGDGEYYDPRKSPILNIFDISAADPKEHFLLPVIVSYVERAGQVGGMNGYLSTEKIYGYAQGLGFHPLQIEAALKRALDKRLLLTPVGVQEDERMRVRITTIGAYTVKRLPSMFAYLDAVIVDTPIVDVQVRSNLQDFRSIEDRLNRTRQFTAYLDASWAKFETKPDYWDWSEYSTRIEEQLNNIEKRVRSGRNE